MQMAKRYEDIINVLDVMSEDDVKIMSYVWDYWRTEYAASAAHVLVSNDDMPAAYRILDKTPKRLRPEARVRLVNQLNAEKHGAFYLENLEKASSEISASLDIPTNRAAEMLIVLTKLYLQVQPTGAGQAFREAVRYINKTDEENPKNEREKDYVFGTEVVPLPADLLENDEQSSLSSLKNLNSRRSRVRLKLGLLESSLPRFVEAKKKFDGLNRKPIKNASTKDS